jgi:DNA-binding GntR family transcriptional regulator
MPAEVHFHNASPLQRVATRAALRSRLSRPRTASSIIHSDLRREIVSLARKPGDTISEKEIAAAYGVSRTPVREAILKLTDERLVESFPQSGTFVARIPVNGLAEAIIIRTALERVTVRLATERQDLLALKQIEALIETQRVAAANEDRNTFHDGDEAFHEAIASAAGHPGIWTLVQTVKFQVDRYRRLTLPAPGRMVRVISEHETILQAIKSGNSERAETCMIDHLEALASFSALNHINPDFLIH